MKKKQFYQKLFLIWQTRWLQYKSCQGLFIDFLSSDAHRKLYFISIIDCKQQKNTLQINFGQHVI